MATFDDETKERLFREADEATDQQLFELWQNVGARLALHFPEDIVTVFEMCLRPCPDAPLPARRPTFENWEVVGSKLIVGNVASRKAVCAAVVQALTLFVEHDTTSVDHV